jgi:hypothetical protein
MSKLLSNIPVYDGSRFSWTNGVGFAEASTLADRAPFVRLYSDSHLAGFYVRSHKTQVEKLFVLESCDWTGSWIFKSTDGFEIRVVND